MSVRRVSPTEADALLRDGGHVFLDVRSVPEFELGHPAGAFNVPWQHQAADGMRDNPDFMRVVRRSFAPDTPLVVGCRTGHRSLLAAARLMEAGFTRVVEMQGGFAGKRDAFGRMVDQGWQQLGLPTATRAEPGRDYAALTGDNADG